MTVPLHRVVGIGFLILAVAVAVLYLGLPDPEPAPRIRQPLVVVPELIDVNGESLSVADARTVVLDYPAELTVDRSAWIRLELPYAGEDDVAQIVTASSISSYVVPIEVVEAGQALTDIFGPDQTLLAAASLTATTFDITPTGSDTQSLDSTHPSWSWNLLPTTRGRQVVTLHVALAWLGPNGEELERQVWQGAIEFHVEEPWFTSGPRVTMMKIVGWMLAAIGSVVLFPSLREFVTRRLPLHRSSTD